jgi:hypothetical protein
LKVQNLRTFSRSLRGFRSKNPEKKSGIKVWRFRVFPGEKPGVKFQPSSGRGKKRQNSIKRHPKITKFEPRPLNTTKKLFPKDLPNKIKPSPPEK